MKRLLFVTIFVATIFNASAYDFSAVAPSGQTLYYSYNGGSMSVSVTAEQYGYLSYPSYTALSGALIIPDSVTYNGHTFFVTSVESDAFNSCRGLTSVIIPNSVTTIGDYAFYNCSGLSGSLTIPNSITSIGNYAFYNCSGLSGSLAIPNSVTSIGNNAFYNCSGLTSVTIPNSVTSIGRHAFSRCSGLTSMTVAAGNTHYDSRNNCNAIIESTTNTLIAGCMNTVIPNSVTSIGGQAFLGCSGLTSVTIPNSVTSIGDYAFCDCTGLTSVIIGDSVTSIGNYAFGDCSGLTAVVIPSSVISIGSRAFYNVAVIIYAGTATGSPWGARGIHGALENGFLYSDTTKAQLTGYIGLDSVIIIPNTVTSIENGAFYQKSQLISVTIPNSVIAIGNYAFEYCSNLASITIPDSVTTIGYNAFRDCRGITFITIGNSVTSIGRYAFSGCNGLTTIWMKPSIPPSLNNSSSLSDSVVDVVVPRNYYGAYVNGDSNYTRHHIFSDTAIVTIVVNDTTRGYFSNDTLLSYPYPDTLEIVAVPYYGYHHRWGDYSTDSIRWITGITHDIAMMLYFDKNQYIVNATSDTAIHGSIRTNSLREYLDIVSVEACPNHGYHFAHWQDGDTTNPRTFTLTQDTHFVAYYGKNIYTLSFISNNDNIGVVDTTSVSGEYLDTTGLIHAIAVPHHHFVRWNDNNTDDPRRFVIDDNHTYMAYFAIDTYSVAVVSSDIVRGSVTGGGTFVYGTPCTVEATAYTGYTFHSWSNGVTANPYTFAVLDDTTLTAIFLAPGEETYTVTVSVNDPTMGTATVNGNAAATVMSGEMVTLLATPNVGYRFVKWSDENTDASRTVTITRDMSFTATFVSTQGIEDVASANLNIYAKDGRICVTLNGQTTDEFSVYDVRGRRAAHVIASDKSPVLPAGIYIVKVGTLPARKVVVIR